jgi:hypothetical protein
MSSRGADADQILGCVGAGPGRNSSAPSALAHFEDVVVDAETRRGTDSELVTLFATPVVYLYPDRFRRPDDVFRRDLSLVAAPVPAE